MGEAMAKKREARAMELRLRVMGEVELWSVEMVGEKGETEGGGGRWGRWRGGRGMLALGAVAAIPRWRQWGRRVEALGRGWGKGEVLGEREVEGEGEVLATTGGLDEAREALGACRLGLRLGLG